MASQSPHKAGEPDSGVPVERRVSQLSAIVLAYNEEVNLPQCLESLQRLDCHIWVVDSGSTDRTIEIAHAYGAEVRYHHFDNYAAQRNWALVSLPVNTPWILNLDADERLTPELADEINSTLAQPEVNASGFLLRRRTVFMGRWIRHGGHYPSYHLRLFRVGRGRCEDRLYDQHFLSEGKVERLKNDYIDVIGSSVSTWSLRHVKWAGLEARDILGASSGGQQVTAELLGNPIQRRRWWRSTYTGWPLFFRAFVYWLYRYFLRLGILDGKEGLIFHFLQGFWFRFLVDTMIWEQRRTPSAICDEHTRY